MNEAQRKKFEEEFKGQLYFDRCTSESSPRCKCGKYTSLKTHATFVGYQAALNSPEVLALVEVVKRRLPDREYDDDCIDIELRERIAPFQTETKAKP